MRSIKSRSMNSVPCLQKRWQSTNEQTCRVKMDCLPDNSKGMGLTLSKSFHRGTGSAHVQTMSLNRVRTFSLLDLSSQLGVNYLHYRRDFNRRRISPGSVIWQHCSLCQALGRLRSNCFGRVDYPVLESTMARQTCP